jgi:zinc protease
MKVKFSKQIVLSALILLCSLASKAQDIPANIKKMSTVEGITEYQIPSNGLRVLLFPDASQSTITVNITYIVGSRHEGYGETGMAHLLEHLVFKGTPKHPQVAKELKDHATRYNGTTWLDRTNYYETMNATDENLEWALDMESDRMINSYIAKKDLDTEFSVVRNEFEARENDPSNVLRERVFSTAFLWHNYGKSTIGNRSDIENVPIENLQGFYRRYYQPDNAVLLVAGKIDPAKTLKLIDKYFSSIPKPTRVLPTTWSTEPIQDGERNVTLKRTGDVQVVSAGYHIPSGTHADFAPVNLLINALTDDPSGRLHKALIKADKAVAQWGYAAQTKEPGLAYFNVDVRKEQNLEDAKKILLENLDAIANTPLTEEEVNRSKTQFLKFFDQIFRNSEQTGTFLSEFMALGDWRTFFLYRDAIEKISAADVNRVAKAYFKASNRTVGMFLPDSKPDRADIPPTPDVTALVDGYKGKAAIAEGEAFEPSIQNVEKRTALGNAGSIKYSFLNKKTRGNKVNALMTLRFGDENSLKGQSVNSAMLTRMLMKGTKNMTQQQLKDKLDGLNATVNIYGSQNNVNVSIETVRDNLPSVIALVTELLKESTLPEKEFGEVRQEALADAERQLTDPDALAQNALDRHLNPYPKDDIRYSSTPQEDIESLKVLKLDDLKSFYKNFYGGSNATVSIIGDFDEAQTKKVLTEGVGSWKSPKPFSRLVSKNKTVAPKSETIKTPDKANATFLAGFNIPMNDADPDFVPMMVGNYVLGAGGLSSRLADRIRQKEGISYGVGSFFNADALDKDAQWGAYAIYAPENGEKLEKAFKEEIERILKDGITEKELTDAKKAMLQNRMVNRATDKQLNSKLNYYNYLQRTMQWDTQYEDKINKLTVDDVNKTLRKHIEYSKISMVKAGDFKPIVKP